MTGEEQFLLTHAWRARKFLDEMTSLLASVTVGLEPAAQLTGRLALLHRDVEHAERAWAHAMTAFWTARNQSGWR